jgi:hypothetical protein
MEDPRTEEMPDPIVGRVPQYGRRAEEEEQPKSIQRLGGGEGPGREEQRVPGEKRGHDQTCLEKDNPEEDEVRPEPIGLDEGVQVFIKVQNKIKQTRKELHKGSSKTGESGPPGRHYLIHIPLGVKRRAF